MVVYKLKLPHCQPFDMADYSKILLPSLNSNILVWPFLNDQKAKKAFNYHHICVTNSALFYRQHYIINERPFRMPMHKTEEFKGQIFFFKL